MSYEMSNAELQENLNLVIEDLYSGLTSLAGHVRAGGSPEDTAIMLEELAFDICRHWPICAELHNLHSESV